MSAAEVKRPNGKVYRRRRPPFAMEFDNLDGDLGGVAVLRTHDVAEAMSLAMELLNRHDMDPSRFRLDWWRLAMRRDELQWVDDAAHGVPTVVWEYA